MQAININNLVMHVHDTGPKSGRALMFSNSLGTDLRIWDRLVALLPSDLRIIRYDMRGHGLSQAPEPPYHMGDLVSDASGLIDHFGLSDVVFVGLSIGGLVAQGLAAERPDVMRGMVLADTAAKIGTEDMWAQRIAETKRCGIAGMSDAVMARWFSPKFRQERPPELDMWRAMLTRTPQAGYVGCCEAIAHTDLWESTARLTLPTLVVVGREDGATPPDLVRETAGLIDGADFQIIARAGHLPCIEQPQVMADLLMGFLRTHNLIQAT